MKKRNEKCSVGEEQKWTYHLSEERVRKILGDPGLSEEEKRAMIVATAKSDGLSIVGKTDLLTEAARNAKLGERLQYVAITALCIHVTESATHKIPVMPHYWEGEGSPHDCVIEAFNRLVKFYAERDGHTPCGDREEKIVRTFLEKCVGLYPGMNAHKIDLDYTIEACVRSGATETLLRYRIVRAIPALLRFLSKDSTSFEVQWEGWEHPRFISLYPQSSSWSEQNDRVDIVIGEHPIANTEFDALRHAYQKCIVLNSESCRRRTRAAMALVVLSELFVNFCQSKRD